MPLVIFAHFIPCCQPDVFFPLPFPSTFLHSVHTEEFIKYKCFDIHVGHVMCMLLLMSSLAD